MGFQLILPFLKPIKHLLEAETVSEIMVNPDSTVWIEEASQLQPLPGIHFDDGAPARGPLRRVIQRACRESRSAYLAGLDSHRAFHRES